VRRFSLLLYFRVRADGPSRSKRIRRPGAYGYHPVKRVTELIDVMNGVEAGDRVRLATDERTHSGVVAETMYRYPDDLAGSVRVDVRVGRRDSDDPGSDANGDGGHSVS